MLGCDSNVKKRSKALTSVNLISDTSLEYSGRISSCVISSTPPK